MPHRRKSKSTLGLYPSGIRQDIPDELRDGVLEPANGGSIGMIRAVFQIV